MSRGESGGGGDARCDSTPVNYCIKFERKKRRREQATESTENAVDYENEIIEYSVWPQIAEQSENNNVIYVERQHRTGRRNP